MLGEDAHRLRDLGILVELREGLLPRLLRIEVIGVLAPLRDAVERDLVRLAVLHRIRDEARVRALVESVRAPEEDLGAAVVVHRPVPPDVRGTPKVLGDLLHVRRVDVVADPRAGPHDVDARIELLAERLLVGVSRTPVDVRAHDERRAVPLLLEEVGDDAVADLGMELRVGSAEVVEEDGKGAEAGVVHPAELAEERLVVRLVPLLEAAAEVDCPGEEDLVRLRDLEELLEVGHLRRRIGLAPLAVVVGIVLRSVDEDVHIVLAHELEEREPSLRSPRTPVVAFHHAAERDRLRLRLRQHGTSGNEHRSQQSSHHTPMHTSDILHSTFYILHFTFALRCGARARPCTRRGPRAGTSRRPSSRQPRRQRTRPRRRGGGRRPSG